MQGANLERGKPKKIQAKRQTDVADMVVQKLKTRMNKTMPQADAKARWQDGRATDLKDRAETEDDQLQG
jgi:hypothetical protein